MHRRSGTVGLPYNDSFLSGKADEWQAFGGTWELVGGQMRNGSDERGAKLVTGSPRWTDYSIEADVTLISPDGDAGLIVRSSDEEQGVDAYSGYYAGVRPIDHALVIGRAGHGWTELSNSLAESPMGPGVDSRYHLKFIAVGCRLGAIATPLPTGKVTAIAITDTDCLRSGRAGLRSYASGGTWSNIRIRRADRSELFGLGQALGKALEAGVPLSEQAAQERQSFWERRAASLGPEPAANLPNLSNPLNPSKRNEGAQPISSLRLVPSTGSTSATIRGSVVLASPVVFVQDATGGVAVHPDTPQALKVGDEVAVTGSAHATPFSSVLNHATVRVLWENTPMPPVSVTASQAATGAFDATFIEVEGRLTGKERGPGDTLIFTLDAGPQSFRTVMSRGRGDSLFRAIGIGSMLRLRGVAVSSGMYTNDLAPFALLLRSSDDALLLAGPPWWSAGHLLGIAVALVVLAQIANIFYHRVESWRLRAVLEERERMAYQMHDTLSQSFAGIGFQLEAIRESMPQNLPKVHQQLDLARELVRHSHDETRRSIAVLRLQQSPSEGLLAALTECAHRLVEGGSVQVIAKGTGSPAKASLRVTDTLFHVGQEALANAIRHAHPTRLEIALVSEKHSIELQIRDDGTGFEQPGSTLGLGLRGMHKRATDIGATLRVNSRLGAGTEILIKAELRPMKKRFARRRAIQTAEWRKP